MHCRCRSRRDCFELAKEADSEGNGAGLVGQITANSFMKREFDKRFIEEFLANRVEVSMVIDSAGAFIPGHGTPTVIIFGRPKRAGRSDAVRAVLGVRGEPGVPVEPRKGQVWSAIMAQFGHSGSEFEWISVLDVQRAVFFRYPWSIGGGGAADLLSLIEAHSDKLGGVIDVVGRTTHTGLDDAFYLPGAASNTRGLARFCAPIVLGEDIRDYLLEAPTVTLFPYASDGAERAIDEVERRFFSHADSPGAPG